MPQAQALAAALQELKTPLDAVINMDVPDDVVVARLSGRRTCRQCGAIYQLVSNPPKQAGVCNACGGELYQRDDDNETTIRQRLAVYRQQTFPLIEFYAKLQLVKTINGTGTPQEVAAAALQAVTS